MKVLVIQDSLRSVGGSEAVVLQTLESLAAVGCMPVAVCRERDPSLLRDIPVYEVPALFRGRREPDLGALHEILDREKPDLVHIHKIPAPDIIRFSCERLPTIVTVHDHAAYCPGGSRVFWRTGVVCTRPLGIPCLIHAYVDRCAARHPARLWHQFTYSTEAMRALQLVNRVLTLSNYVREQLLRSGLRANQVTVLPHWVDIPPLNAAPGQSKTVLFVGRLSREKGVPILLRALALLQVPFEAVIVGDGPLRQHCEKLATELRIGESVHFRGWLHPQAVQTEYSECAMLAFPSLWPEPFGLVGMEAMAHGKPVVAFDVGGVRDWLTDRVDGLLVPRGDAEGLAAAIGELLTKPESGIQMGEAARVHVGERFNRRLNVGRLVATYGELLN